MRFNKKLLLVTTLCGGMIFGQAFAQHHDDDDAPPTNLKILPKDISHKELMKVMREFSKSLGVHCGFCHVSEKVDGQDRPKMDFASDNKTRKKYGEEHDADDGSHKQ